MSMFAPKPGCPMCSIVRAASLEPLDNSKLPSSNISGSKTGRPEILWRDDNFTAYLEKENPVSSNGHVVIVFNLHIPSIYSLSSSDLPLLSIMQQRAKQLLHMIRRPQSLQTGPCSSTSSTVSTHVSLPISLNIGFITFPFKDNKIPVTDHLHAHAYIGQPDLAGWWRRIAYSHAGWYAIDDLIAEIRESTSNNRVKSGYTNRGPAPIDLVPDAGSRTGRPDGIETTPQGLGINDIESGQFFSPHSS